MSRKICLDLFAGLGGFSAAFADSPEWLVVTVDIEERFDPDIRDDVMTLRPSGLLETLGVDRDEINLLVILASPPCNQLSLAASRYERFRDGEPQTDDARDAVALVYHAIGLIRGLAPDYWFLENPQGYLRQVIGDPTGRVTYRRYGEDTMKPTDLWGDHPPMTYRSCAYGSDCHLDNTDQDHGGLGNLNLMGTRDPAERAEVPYELSEQILEAVDGVGGQATLEQATTQG